MPHTHTNTIDEDISLFANTVPPPPYSVTGNTGEPRPRLPEEKRNIHLSTRKSLMMYWDEANVSTGRRPSRQIPDHSS
jgi:hypothetical protein